MVATLMPDNQDPIYEAIKKVQAHGFAEPKLRIMPQKPPSFIDRHDRKRGEVRQLKPLDPAMPECADCGHPIEELLLVPGHVSRVKCHSCNTRTVVYVVAVEVETEEGV